MKHFHSRLLLILLLISLLLNGYFVISQRFTKTHSALPTVTTVLDGDTFTINTGKRIRLLGTNAPEINRCFGKEAKERLEQLLLGKNVTITEEKNDNFNRTMGLVYVDEQLINTQLIQEGYAKPDYTKNSQKDLFIAAYDQAKEKKVGLGGTVCKRTNTDPLPNPNCPIKGNIEGSSGEQFYHLPRCRHYNQIVIDLDTDEDFFCSEAEAQKAGFVLAKDCLR